MFVCYFKLRGSVSSVATGGQIGGMLSLWLEVSVMFLFEFIESWVTLVVLDSLDLLSWHTLSSTLIKQHH